MTEKKEKIKFFDEASESWDEKIPPIDGNPVFEEWFSSLCIKNGDAVLDFGCGTGRLIPRIWEKIKPDGKIYAVDFSPSMISTAQKKFSHIPVIWYCAFPESLPIPPESLDAIILLSVFPHFDDMGKDLLYLSQKLKNDGHLWIVHLEGRDKINSLHKQIGRAVGSDLIPEKRTARKILLSANLKIIKFEDTKAKYIIHCQKKV